jgi:hypothetical protein
MDSIAKYKDKERDVAFLVGLDKGELKKWKWTIKIHIYLSFASEISVLRS